MNKYQIHDPIERRLRDERLRRTLRWVLGAATVLTLALVASLAWAQMPSYTFITNISNQAQGASHVSLIVEMTNLADNETVATLHWERVTNWVVQGATTMAGNDKSLLIDEGRVCSNLVADIEWEGTTNHLLVTNKDVGYVTVYYHINPVKVYTNGPTN